jgi:hypothetical protein
MDKILLDINQGKYIKNFFLLYGVLAEKIFTFVPKQLSLWNSHANTQLTNRRLKRLSMASSSI